MKLQCELCGGTLQMEPGGRGAVCTACGLGYTLTRLRELLGGTGSAPVPAPAPKPAPVSAPAPAPKPRDPREGAAGDARRTGGFLLTVEDVYTVAGRGVDVLGTVEQGTVAVGDGVAVNGAGSYAVTAISHQGRMQERAGQGMPVALCLRGLDESAVTAGDVITCVGKAKPPEPDHGIIYDVAHIEYLTPKTDVQGIRLADVEKIPIQTEPFSMYISRARCRSNCGKWMLEVEGTVQSGCVANLDTVFLNGSEQSRWTVVSTESQTVDPIYNRASRGMAVALTLMGEKRAEIKNAVSLWGVATPTESLDHFAGTPRQFFAALLERDFADWDIYADAQWGGVTRPISFLLCRSGKPRLAVFLLDSWDGQDRWQVEKSMGLCAGQGVKALQFFNDYRNESAYVTRRIREELGETGR